MGILDQIGLVFVKEESYKVNYIKIIDFRINKDLIFIQSNLVIEYCNI
jgi:hypothetical protein